MIALPNSYSAVELALKIERLEAVVAGLQGQLEVETQRANHFAAEYEQLAKTVKAVEFLDCSAGCIENNGCERFPWEIEIETLMADGTRQNHRKYYGWSLRQALEQMAKKEVTS